MQLHRHVIYFVVVFYKDNYITDRYLEVEMKGYLSNSIIIFIFMAQFVKKHHHLSATEHSLLDNGIQHRPSVVLLPSTMNLHIDQIIRLPLWRTLYAVLANLLSPLENSSVPMTIA